MTTTKLQSSPFVRKPLKTKTLMFWVMLCLLPGLLVQSLHFGIGTLVQVLLASTVSLVSESLVMVLRKRSVFSTLSDNSALVTGILIGLALPAYAPWWITVIGASFAILVVKHLYGGLGHNIFNPAMAAYVLLLVSFPVTMTSWMPPQSLLHETLTVADGLSLIFNGYTVDGFSIKQIASIDGHTIATPLDEMKTQLTLGFTSTEIANNEVFGRFAGIGWQWINAAYLVGGIALVYLKVIRWHIPLAFLGTLLALSLLSSAIHPDHSIPTLLQLFSGATMIGAFFILTDPVSAATSNKGRIIYGSLVALLVFVIRNYGGYPDAVAFAVLLSNMAVPMIDHFTKPRVYGYGEGSNNEQ
ncbi:electron transport complex subunit RsxD [Agarivorans sp. 1_MG-2023]|uniref:electron transport complex subunit RsxD n=1 Tax=Agarivorans sp. 1_MG-2023 TaxID=3062634 RepID=UPI0026E2A3E2|nr:electron transport complex subunit RsxD [Agarivorans sp. 1_MG-2023]MDO6766145.1 electron transport complex subunit RsxD [Agarivorans sp. 1_MG-2023]